jgi:hypothetical protein
MTTAPLLIGLTGRAGAGKDTVACYLEAQYAFAPIGFADPIRDMLGVLLQHVDVDGAWLCERELKELPAPVLGLSYRHLAQTLGTEWGRTLHADLWLRIAEFRVNQRLDGGDNVVLCDVRFPNEAAWLRAAGGQLVRVEREAAHGRARGRPRAGQPQRPRRAGAPHRRADGAAESSGRRTLMTVPREGSVAHRAIAHLGGLPVGTQLTSGELCEALAIATSTLVPCLKAAIRSGEIRVDMADPRKHLYSVPAPGAAPRVASVFDLSGTTAAQADAGVEAPPEHAASRTARHAPRRWAPHRRPSLPGACPRTRRHPPMLRCPHPPRRHPPSTAPSSTPARF